MLLRDFILIFVVLVGILFAAVDAHSSFPVKKTTSCGLVELQQCWCLDENPCDHSHKSKKIGSDVIPVISKKTILTAKHVKEHIQSSSPTKLDLSRQNFEGIDRNAFDNFTDLKSLDLSGNKLSKLPAFIFSKLTNLEHLSLSGNGLKKTRKLFAGLSNLKTLNITENRLSEVLDDDCFFGLTKSCDIHITPASVKKLGTNAFGNEPSMPVQYPTNKASNDEVLEAKSIHTRSAPWPYYSDRITDLQICIENNIVQRLDEIKVFEKLQHGCQEVKVRSGNMFFSNLGIIDFEKGWYLPQDKKRRPVSFSVLRITGNNMTRVSDVVVNELPEYITWLDMSDNQIERLDTGTFVHDHIFSLELNNNLIAEIADNTFKMPKLYQLYLRNNRLKDTKFFATMPSHLSSIDLTDNEIEEISPNSFSTLKNLRWLSLERNRVTALDSTCLHGATLLGSLILSGNRIMTIEPGTFDNLSLGALSLEDNQISTIEKGVFNPLVDVDSIHIAGNKLKKILSGTFDLPALQRLDLRKNEITEIEKGAAKSLGRLDELNLSSNPIKKLENGALFGLNKTRNCHVHLVHTPIEVIQGGVFDEV